MPQDTDHLKEIAKIYRAHWGENNVNATYIDWAATEIEKLRALIGEVGSGDWTDAAYAAELPFRLAESGWFKRARAALTS